MKREIYQNVIQNKEIREITTPYFKFYENQVHCQEGNIEFLEKSLREYYGAMLQMGATTLFEEFNPELDGAKQYAMYGNPYEKSLCHAWSANPVYLLGRYRMGVKNTGIAYETYEVSPYTKGLDRFSGIVPLPNGEVRIRVDKESISVVSTAEGGTLIYNRDRLVLKPEKVYTVPRKENET